MLSRGCPADVNGFRANIIPDHCRLMLNQFSSGLGRKGRIASWGIAIVLAVALARRNTARKSPAEVTTAEIEQHNQKIIATSKRNKQDG